MWFYIITGIASIAFGIILFYKRFKLQQRIDSHSIATLRKSVYLGTDALKKIYALTYYVENPKEPFDLLVTPCKQNRPIGEQRIVYYESADPSKNFYFKKKLCGKLNISVFKPLIFVLLGGVMLIYPFLY